jgi:hypothetical protein
MTRTVLQAARRARGALPWRFLRAGAAGFFRAEAAGFFRAEAAALVPLTFRLAPFAAPAPGFPRPAT